MDFAEVYSGFCGQCTVDFAEVHCEFVVWNSTVNIKLHVLLYIDVIVIVLLVFYIRCKLSLPIDVLTMCDLNTFKSNQLIYHISHFKRMYTYINSKERNCLENLCIYNKEC